MMHIGRVAMRKSSSQHPNLHKGPAGHCECSTIRCTRPSLPTLRGNCRAIWATQGSAIDLASAGCMEEVYAALADRVLSAAADLLSSASPSPPRRYMVGIAGVPGSGKSTLAAEITGRINAIAGRPVAVQVPMDGFHLYRRQLDDAADPAAAHARRGAHWTFDASAYAACMRRLKAWSVEGAPSFDHGKGDPVEGDISVLPTHTIVLSEGNYLLLDEDPWCQLRSVFDDSWYVDCDLGTAMERVFKRQTGNGVAPVVSKRRVTGNDLPNGELIERSRGRAALLVPSLPLRSGGV